MGIVVANSHYQCKDCGRQFLDFYSPKGYSSTIKEEWLKMQVNGLGFRAIERVKGVNHNTVIRWVKQVANLIPDSSDNQEIPEVGEIDELQTFVGKKKDKIWLWTAVDHKYSNILQWNLGDRSAKTFEKLWDKIKHWGCFFWVTDGYKVYPIFIPNEDHIVSKTYMTRVEVENSRLRHYLARLHRKTFCYSKSLNMLKASIKLLLYYLKYKEIPLSIECKSQV